MTTFIIIGAFILGYALGGEHKTQELKTHPLWQDKGRKK